MVVRTDRRTIGRASRTAWQTVSLLSGLMFHWSAKANGQLQRTPFLVLVVDRLDSTKRTAVIYPCHPMESSSNQQPSLSLYGARQFKRLRLAAETVKIENVRVVFSLSDRCLAVPLHLGRFSNWNAIESSHKYGLRNDL